MDISGGEDGHLYRWRWTSLEVYWPTLVQRLQTEPPPPEDISMKGRRGGLAFWVTEREHSTSLSSNLWLPVHGLGTQGGESRASRPRVIGSECSLNDFFRVGMGRLRPVRRIFWGGLCPTRGTLVSPRWQSQLCWGCQHWAGYACSQLAIFWKEAYGEIGPISPLLGLVPGFSFFLYLFILIMI